MSAPFPISSLRSVELLVPDIAAAKAFYTSVWGLLDAGQQDGSLLLRGCGTDPYLVALAEGPHAGIGSVTWRAADGADLHDLRARCVDAGAKAEGEVRENAALAGGAGFVICDPAGRRHVIVRNDRRADPVQNDLSRPVRLAHVNINSADLDGDIRFMQAALGFRLSDRTGAMGFLRTNDDHHAVVLAQAPVNTLNHIAFLHDSLDDVMRAGGRMCDAGFPIGWGPGRHGPGDNVFLYFVDPFGIVLEHTAEVLQVDEDYKVGTPEDWRWPPGRTDQWGIAPPKTEACKAAQLAMPFVQDGQLRW